MSNQTEIELRGPAFTQSAVEISQKVALKSISKLFIYNVTADSIKALEGALQKLSRYFTGDGVVIVTTSQNLPFNTQMLLQTAAKVPVRITNPTVSVPFQNPQSDSIMSQLAADAQKQQAERWKIMQDHQTKIFEITQDVTVNKARTADRAFQAMDSYIRQ